MRKNLILTQLSIIKKVNSNLIVCLTGEFKDNKNIKLYLRDVIQTYFQSISHFKCEFYIRPSLELILLSYASFNHVIKNTKPVYGILKASSHRFATYQIHHREKLRIKKSIYNHYFLYNSGLFSIMRIWINNTFIFVDNNFENVEEDAIKSAKIVIKNRNYLILAPYLKFNGIQISLNLDRMIMLK